MTKIEPNVDGRRVLHFGNLNEIVTDADALAAAEKAGKLRTIGNWSLGQTCGHLAAWINYGFDGVPLHIPWYVRLVTRPMKNWVLNKPMRTGAKIRKTE